MATTAYELIAALGLNRAIWNNGYRITPYVKGSEKWENEDVFSFDERGSFGRVSRSYRCRHENWRSICTSCMSAIWPGLGNEQEQQVCEDDGTPYHAPGSVEDVPLWHPGERKAYGRFAEQIEMDDDLKHAFD